MKTGNRLLRAALLAMFAATSAPALAQEKAPLDVVASFSIIADMAANVGGERVRVATLVGRDGNIHAWEPRPADAATVLHADVVLFNGLELEGAAMMRMVQSSGRTKPVVMVSEGVQRLRNADVHDDDDDDDDDHDGHDGHGHEHHDAPGHDGHHHHGQYDPHAWQSVPQALVYVGNIEHAFCDADPAGCPAYRANAENYRASLSALDAEIRQIIGSIAPQRRRVITGHNAFSYFGREYGLTFLAAENTVGGSASAADVAALVRQIRAQKAAAIFIENITNPRLMEQIAAETGVRIGGTLYSDALSATSGPAPTYIEMMRHNATTIRDATK